jgi:protein-tyrosine phosphatase
VIPKEGLSAMPSILFVCTANLYRSPLAAAFLRDELKTSPDNGRKWAIDSAGTWTKPGTPIHPQTIEDAHRFGLDVREHRSKQVSAELLAKQDLILVMESGHKEALHIEFSEKSEKIYLLSEVVDGMTYDIPDPFSNEGIHDRDIVNELQLIIKRGLKNIISMATTDSFNPSAQNHFDEVD